MGHVVVGVDGSTASRMALRWASAVSKASGMALRPVAAWEYPASMPLPLDARRARPATQMDHETRDGAQQVVVDELGAVGQDLEVEVGRGPAARVLLECAGRPDATMLVVGARGLGGFEGLLLGSVSQQCAEHAPCRVVIVRGQPEAASGQPRRIIAGLDGSPASSRALEWAAGLARDTGAAVVVVHAAGSGSSASLVSRAGRVLEEEWCRPLRALGLDYTTRVEGGDARSVLVDVADDTGADLIVVGTRGLGPIRGLLLGSVAGYLVRYATRSVAVVRPPDSV